MRVLSSGPRPHPHNVARRDRVVLGLVLVLLTCVLGGCGTGRQESSHPVSRFKDDRAAWRLPMDELVPQPLRRDLATSLLTSRCTGRHGVRVPVIDSRDYLGETVNTHLRQLFDPALAARYGYHSAPSRRDPRSVPVVHLSARQRPVYQRCFAAAGRALHLDDASESSVQKLAGEAFQRAKSASPVRQAAKAWAQCVADLGLPTLPASPLEMPTKAQAHGFGWPPASEDSARPPLPPREKAQARHDAECRETTGYAAALYRAEVLAQLELMRRYPQVVMTARTSVARSRPFIDRTIRTLDRPERSAGDRRWTVPRQ